MNKVVLSTSLLLMTAAAAAADVDDVVGDWTLTMEMRGNTRTQKLHLEKSDDGLAGTWGGRGRQAELNDVSFKDGKLSFAIVRETPRGEMKMNFSGKVEGDAISGELETPFGKTEVTGKRGWDPAAAATGPTAARGMERARERAGRREGRGVRLPRGEFPAGETPGELRFRAHNSMYKADGKFATWRFTEVDIPDGDLEKGSVTIEVDMASVWEKANALAEHLRTADFFDVEKFAKAKITIDGAKKGEDDSYVALAVVEMHGKTSEVPVNFEVTSKVPLQIAGSAVLSRTAFGIGRPHQPDNERSITDEVEIELTATLPVR